MGFVHKQTVNAQFLKGHNAVFLLAVRQLLQLGFEIFLGFLHLLDGVALAVLGFCGIVFATGTPVSNSMVELYVRP